MLNIRLIDLIHVLVYERGRPCAACVLLAYNFTQHSNAQYLDAHHNFHCFLVERNGVRPNAEDSVHIEVKP